MPWDHPALRDWLINASEWRANPRYRNVQAVEVPNAVD